MSKAFRLFDSKGHLPRVVCHQVYTVYYDRTGKKVSSWSRALRPRDRLKIGWLNGFSFRKGCRESRRHSRNTYPESYITKYTSIQSITGPDLLLKTRSVFFPALRHSLTSNDSLVLAACEGQLPARKRVQRQCSGTCTCNSKVHVHGRGIIEKNVLIG